MSMVGSKNNNMTTPFFHEFKKQASFYLKEKIKTARLALTDVTPAELLTEEATNGNQWAPDARTMGIISRAAFEVDDFYRIAEVLHRRLVRFDKTIWRVSYKALIILEHLLTHGPESVAEEFQCDRDAIHEMESFQYIDERGFNWGLTVRKKSERVQKLLESGPLLKEERDRSRKISRGIEGFGSFVNRSSTEAGDSGDQSFGRSNSTFKAHENNQFLFSGADLYGEHKKTRNITHDSCSLIPFDTPRKDLNGLDSSSDLSLTNFYNSKFQTSFKENMVPAEEAFRGKHNELECMTDSNGLIAGQKDESKTVSLIEEDHPFNNHEQHTTSSLLSISDDFLYAGVC